VRVLNTPATTGRAQIVAALEALARETGPGDTVFISFSGHGTRVKDLDGDEADGFDEVLVAREGMPAGGILDDDIDRYLRAILARDPANVTFLVDSCNAGGVSRGTWINRDYPGTPGRAAGAADKEELWTRRHGPLDCFYAARSGEAAADLLYSGAFTDAFLRVARP